MSITLTPKVYITIDDTIAVSFYKCIGNFSTSQDFSQVFKVKSRIVSAFEKLFKITSKVSKAFKSQFKIKGATSKIQKLRFKIKGGAQRSFKQLFKIKGALRRAFSQRFKLKGALQLAFSKRFKLKGALQQSLSQRWKAIGALARQFESRFSIQGSAARLFETVFSIQSTVKREFLSRFAIQGDAQNVLQIPILITSSIQNQFSSVFQIEGITAQAEKFLYEIRGTTSQIQKEILSIAGSVQREFSDVFSAIGDTSRILTLPYLVSGQAQRGIEFVYQVASTVRQRFSDIFAVEGNTSRIFQQVFSINSIVSQTFNSIFEVNGITSRIATLSIATQGAVSIAFSTVYSAIARSADNLKLLFTSSGYADSDHVAIRYLVGGLTKSKCFQELIALGNIIFKESIPILINGIALAQERARYTIEVFLKSRVNSYFIVNSIVSNLHTEPMSFRGIVKQKLDSVFSASGIVPICSKSLFTAISNCGNTFRNGSFVIGIVSRRDRIYQAVNGYIAQRQIELVAMKGSIQKILSQLSSVVGMIPIATRNFLIVKGLTQVENFLIHKVIGESKDNAQGSFSIIGTAVRLAKSVVRVKGNIFTTLRNSFSVKGSIGQLATNIFSILGITSKKYSQIALVNASVENDRHIVFMKIIGGIEGKGQMYIGVSYNRNQTYYQGRRWFR